MTNYAAGLVVLPLLSAWKKLAYLPMKAVLWHESNILNYVNGTAATIKEKDKKHLEDLKCGYGGEC